MALFKFIGGGPGFEGAFGVGNCAVRRLRGYGAG
jgi:hypothetical protein